MTVMWYVLVGMVIVLFLAIFATSVYAFVEEWKIRSVMDTQVVSFEKLLPKKHLSFFTQCKCKNAEGVSIRFETSDKKIKNYKEGDELRVFQYNKKYYWEADNRLFPMLVTIVCAVLSMVCIVEAITPLVALITHNV